MIEVAFLIFLVWFLYSLHDDYMHAMVDFSFIYRPDSVYEYKAIVKLRNGKVRHFLSEQGVVWRELNGYTVSPFLSSRLEDELGAAHMRGEVG